MRKGDNKTRKDEEEVTVTKLVSSATENVSGAELALAEEEILKNNRPVKYQTDVPKNIKLEVAQHAKDFGTASAIKKVR